MSDTTSMTFAQALALEEQIYSELQRRKEASRQKEADYWNMGAAGVRAQIDMLLDEAPDSALPRVAEFLRDLAAPPDDDERTHDGE